MTPYLRNTDKTKHFIQNYFIQDYAAITRDNDRGPIATRSVLHMSNTIITGIVCIRPKGRTQCTCIFPRSQHSYLHVYIYILTKSEFISSCSWPAVGSNIAQITRTTFLVNVFFFKMAAGSHFGCPKITLYRISYHFRSIPQFLFL